MLHTFCSHLWWVPTFTGYKSNNTIVIQNWHIFFTFLQLTGVDHGHNGNWHVHTDRITQHPGKKNHNRIGVSSTPSYKDFNSYFMLDQNWILLPFGLTHSISTWTSIILWFSSSSGFRTHFVLRSSISQIWSLYFHKWNVPSSVLCASNSRPDQQRKYKKRLHQANCKSKGLHDIK